MKKLMSFILTFAILLSLSTTALAVYNESDFSDIPADWSHDAVVAAIENGLLQGYDGKINPEGFLSRAEMAAIIVRTFGGTVQADISAFTDVTSDKWYYGEMAVAVQMGIFEGDGTSLRPEDYITREQAALVLSRAFKLTDSDVDLSTFTDFNNISGWALDGVAAVIKAGYMQGDGSNLFPLDNISRKEFAQLMYNLVSSYITESGTITAISEGNIVVRSPGVILEGVTINGDIIVGDGVGSGDFTLKDCTLNGRLIVRGGGTNSIYILNSGISGPVIVTRRDGSVHVNVDDDSHVQTIVVDDGLDQVIVSGDFDELTVNSDVDVILKGATVDKVAVSAANANVTVDKDSSVSSVDVLAKDVSIDVDGKVTNVNVGADVIGALITGSGTVENVLVKAGSEQTRVETTGTIVVNLGDTPVTTVGGESIAPGTTGKTGSVKAEGRPLVTTYYSLKLSISSLSNSEAALTAASTSTSLSGNSSFYSEVISLVSKNLDTMAGIFDDPDAKNVMDTGIEAYSAGDTQWKAFVENYLTVIGDNAVFQNRTATLSQLVGKHTFNYTTKADEYKVTVTVTAK